MRAPLSIALAGAIAAVAAPPPAHGITGGDVVDAKRGAAAAMFTTRGKGVRGQCSGVLVAPRAVLTAAHCVRSPRGAALRVRSVRIGNPRGKTQRVKVKSIHVHPDYDPAQPARGSDLAVLILRADARATPVSIATAESDPSAGDKLTVMGFGLTRRGRHLRRSTKTLRGATLELLSPFACFSGPVKEMAKTRACAANPKASLCPGDSGSGFLHTADDRTVVVGIASVVLDAGRCWTGPAIMTRVSPFAAWIEKTITP